MNYNNERIDYQNPNVPFQIFLQKSLQNVFFLLNRLNVVDVYFPKKYKYLTTVSAKKQKI